jgi:hypothetical protein
MNRFRNFCLITAFAAGVALGPSAAWSTRVFSDLVSGEITATPVSGSIEVDHHSYRVKAQSAADKELHGFSEGQKVDLVLDGPPDSRASEVILITVHEAS